jgi:hypothetical protein
MLPAHFTCLARPGDPGVIRLILDRH